MPNGTLLNNVFAARIHKSNAQEVVDDANSMLEYYASRLTVLAASSPQKMEDGIDWPDYVLREVGEIVSGMREEWWKQFCANYIIESPGYVQDELDPADWKEIGE